MDGDDDRALELYKTGAKMGNARCILGADRTCQLDQFIDELTMSYEEAVKVLQQLAESGDAMAAYELGCAYYYGDIPVREDMCQSKEYYQQQAVKWFEMAAKQGVIKAMLNVSTCYRNGEGCEVDIAKGRQYIELVAEKGDMECQRIMDNIYNNGKEVPQDIDCALKWYQRAANQHDIASLRSIACIHYNDEKGHMDYAKSLSIFEDLAFNRGDADSYGYLFYMAREGLGGPVDLNKAHDYCEKGA